MELITFQTMSAFRSLISKGFLLTNTKYINKDKVGKAYEWIISKMEKQIVKPEGASYPLWAWYQYGKRKCPPRHKTLGYFAPEEDVLVKITFHKEEKDVFLTNFNLYSFLLNNRYIPTNRKEYENFEKRLKDSHISNNALKAYARENLPLDKPYIEIIQEIQKSFDHILDPGKDRIQACVWNLMVKDIIKVEFISRKECVPRNYKAGRNYIKEYIDSLT